MLPQELEVKLRQIMMKSTINKKEANCKRNKELNIAQKKV